MATGTQPTTTNYRGWTPSPSNPFLDRLSPSLPPAEFLSSYVLLRKPALFTSHFAGAPQRWTNLTYLGQKAGRVKVRVERMDARSGGFGSGLPRVEMPFCEFLEKLTGSSGEEMYLTTQYDDEVDAAAPEDSLPEPFTCPPPCNALADDFPLRPAILQSLVPHQVNLWLGRSRALRSAHTGGLPAGSGESPIDWTQSRSSGLHHDHHDNLYVLLSGYKRFVLFPPSAHPHLSFHSSASGARVHDNGVVSYEGDAIGSDALTERERWGWEVRRLQGVVSELKKKRKREKAAAKNEPKKLKLKGVGRKKTALEVELEAAEEALADAEDKYLDAIGEEGLDFGGEGMRDDFDALGDIFGAGNDVLEVDGDAGDDASSVAETASVAGSVNGKGKGKAREEDGSTEPSSFSRIPVSVLHAQLGLPSGSGPQSTSGQPSMEIPADVDLESLNPIVVYLKPGEMLYLPASWIHEVSSASAPSISAPSSQKRARGDAGTCAQEGLSDVHMAFNYWFYPPDADEKDTPGIYKMQPLFDCLGTVIEEKWGECSGRGEGDEGGGGKRVKLS